MYSFNLCLAICIRVFTAAKLRVEAGTHAKELTVRWLLAVSHRRWCYRGRTFRQRKRPEAQRFALPLFAFLQTVGLLTLQNGIQDVFELIE